MFISCSKCGFSSEISDDLLPEKGKARNVSCPRCEHAFLVSRDHGVTEISEGQIEEAPIEGIEEIEDVEEAKEESAEKLPAQEQPAPQTDPSTRPKKPKPASAPGEAPISPKTPRSKKDAGSSPKQPSEAMPKRPPGAPPEQPPKATPKKASGSLNRPRSDSPSGERQQPPRERTPAVPPPPQSEPVPGAKPAASPAPQAHPGPTPAQSSGPRPSPARPTPAAARENVAAKPIAAPRPVEVKSSNTRVIIVSMIIVALILLPGYMIHSLVKNGKARNSWDRYLEYAEANNSAMELVSITEAIDRDGNNAEYYSTRAETLNEMGSYSEAKNDANEALRLDPGLNEAYFNRGMASMGMGQYDNAIADFETVLGNDPIHSGAIYGRGEAYFMLELYNQALEDLEKACNLGIPEACDRVSEILEIRGE